MPPFLDPTWRVKVREFLFGLTGMEFAQHALEMRASVETLFMAATVGDLIGLPILAVLFAVVGYFAVDYAWRIYVRCAWQRRRKHRMQKT